MYALVVSLPLKLFLHSQTFSCLPWIVILLLEKIYTKLFKLVRAMKSGQVEEDLCS
jgi:hypothetical protein